MNTTKKRTSKLTGNLNETLRLGPEPLALSAPARLWTVGDCGRIALPGSGPLLPYSLLTPLSFSIGAVLVVHEFIAERVEGVGRRDEEGKVCVWCVCFPSHAEAHNTTYHADDACGVELVLEYMWIMCALDTAQESLAISGWKGGVGLGRLVLRLGALGPSLREQPNEWEWVAGAHSVCSAISMTCGVDRSIEFRSNDDDDDAEEEAEEERGAAYITPHGFINVLRDEWNRPTFPYPHHYNVTARRNRWTTTWYSAALNNPICTKCSTRARTPKFKCTRQGWQNRKKNRALYAKLYAYYDTLM